jgi:hypothetical protein
VEIFGHVPLAPVPLAPIGLYPFPALTPFLHPTVQDHVHGLAAEDVLEICAP